MIIAPGTSPIGALGELAHRMADQREPAFPLFVDTQAFVETAQASEALKARARQMRDDFIRALAVVLAEAADRPSDDADAYLAAALITSAWSTAFVRSHAEMSETGDFAAAKGIFLALVDRGVRGTHTALSDTPYATGP